MGFPYRLVYEDIREYDFYIFVPGDFDLDFWPLDLKFASLVTLVQRYVSTNFEVSTAFLFRENRRHVKDGQTDGVQQHIMRPPREDRVMTPAAFL